MHKGSERRCTYDAVLRIRPMWLRFRMIQSQPTFRCCRIWPYNLRFQSWPSRDPINEVGFNLLVGRQDAFNGDEERTLYAFVRNSSVNNIDHLGLSFAAPVAGWIAGDCAIPDPTDAVWPKWAVYGIAICGAVAIDACFTTRTYTCRVFCPLIATGGNNNAEVGTVQATGTGKTYAEACRNAERAARNAAPPGTRTKHCQWR